jgi:uncharacterized membrane protein
MGVREAMEVAASAVDVAGVMVILVGIANATVLLLSRSVTTSPDLGRYQSYRHGIGRAILLGLEFLIAADIIRTVAVSPGFEGIGIVALIVLIRTFLSFTLELDLEGRPPWARKGREKGQLGPETAPRSRLGPAGDVHRIRPPRAGA